MTSHVQSVRELPLLAPEATVVQALRWAAAQAVMAWHGLLVPPYSLRAHVDHPSQTAVLELVLAPTVGPGGGPPGRAAVLACGAAMLNLRLALSAASVGCGVELCPDEQRPDLLAVLRLGGVAEELPRERVLREAVPAMGERRGRFEPGRVPSALLDHLVAEAAYEGALVEVVPDEVRSGLRALDGLAHRRGEAHTWPFGSHPSPDDGVLLAVAAAGDDRERLLLAGAGLQRVLLAVTAAGLAHRSLNAALEHEDLRASASRLLGCDHLQAVVALGFGEPDTWPLTPDVDEVLTLRD